MQLNGTMDIDCPAWMDWFHGGLQFQTEHHLFPRWPRHKLRQLREEVVKPYANPSQTLGMGCIYMEQAPGPYLRHIRNLWVRI